MERKEPDFWKETFIYFWKNSPANKLSDSTPPSSSYMYMIFIRTGSVSKTWKTKCCTSLATRAVGGLYFRNLKLTCVLYSVANTFELQGAANSSPTRKHFSEGAQFLIVLKSARKSKFGRYCGFFNEINPNTPDWAPKLENTTWSSKHPVLHFPID